MNVFFRPVVAILVLCAAIVHPSATAQRAQDGARELGDVAREIKSARSTQERVAAIRSLSSFKNSAARQFLLELLDDYNAVEIRTAVYLQLRRHPHTSVVQRIERELSRRESATELRAIARCLTAQGKKGQTALLKALRSKRADVQSAAIYGLRFVNDPTPVTAALVKAYDRAPPKIKIEILGTLARQKDKKPLQQLCMKAIAREKNPAVRSNALRQLHECPGPRALKALTKAFQTGKTRGVLNDAAFGLAGQGRSGVEVLAGALESESKLLRAAAIHGLSVAPKTRVTLHALIAAFESSPAKGQEGILRAMSGYKDSSDLTDVRLRALTAEHPGTRTEALAQIAANEYRETRATAVEMARDPAVLKQATYKGRVVYALGTVLDEELFPLFLRLCADPSWTVRNQVNRLLKDKSNRVMTMLGERGLKQRGVAARLTVLALLAEIESKHSSNYLVQALDDTAPEVIAFAVRTLVKRKDQRVIPFLQKGLKHRDENLRLQAMQSLHEFRKDSPRWPKQVLQILREGRGAIRFVALDLLAELRYRPALELAQSLFEDPTWPVRSAAYHFCRRVRDVSSIPLLIARLPAESGRLRAEAIRTLRSLALRTYREPGQWKQWWEAARDEFELPPAPRADARGRAGPTVMTYYSIPLESKAVCFLIDTSGSMKEKVGTSRITRLQAAKDALKYVINNCAPGFQFNLIAFGNNSRAWKRALIAASDEHKAEARKFVKRFRASGGTNVHEAMQQAFADGQIDTIYLLSDGQPSVGEITDENDLADEVRVWNTQRRILIHTISIGRDSMMMQRLAKESGGTYVRRL